MKWDALGSLVGMSTEALRPPVGRTRRERLRRIVIVVGLVSLVVGAAWVVGVISGVIAVRVTGVSWVYLDNGTVSTAYAFTGSCTGLKGSYHPDMAIHCQLQLWGPRGGYLSTNGFVSVSPPFSGGLVPPPPCYGYGCQTPTSLSVVIVTPWLPGSYMIQAQVTG